MVGDTVVVVMAAAAEEREGREGGEQNACLFQVGMHSKKIHCSTDCIGI